MRFLFPLLCLFLPAAAAAQTQGTEFDVPFWETVISAETCGADELSSALRDPRGRSQCPADGRRCFEQSALTLARICGAGMDVIATSPCAQVFDADPARGLSCLLRVNYSIPNPVIAGELGPEVLNSQTGRIVMALAGGTMDVAPRQLSWDFEDATEDAPNSIYIAHREAVLARTVALVHGMPHPNDIRRYSRMSLPDRRRIMSAIETSLRPLSAGCPFQTGGRSPIEAVFESPEMKYQMERLGEAVAAMNRILAGEEVSKSDLPPAPPPQPELCRQYQNQFPYQDIVRTIGFVFGMTEQHQ